MSESLVRPTPPVTQALVLCAGLGTRLRPLTLLRAKPALPVAGEPLVRRIVDWLVRNGVIDIVVNLHHLPASIAGVLGDGSDLGGKVRYSWEQPHVLGSAGGPRHALDIVGADRFFIVNGDTLTDVDLQALADAHIQFSAEVTLALTPNVEANRYGGVRLDDDGRVVQFVPRGTAAVGSDHFIGVQIVNASAIRELVDGQPVNSVGGLYDDVIRRLPGAVRGVVSKATFHDIGTIADYWTTSFQLAAAEQAHIGRSSRIATSARVTRSILWDGASVGERCVVDRCIIADGVHLFPGTTLTRTIAAIEPGGGLRTWPLDIAFND